MKTILLCTAALFAVCSAAILLPPGPVPSGEELAPTDTSNMCVSLSYTPLSPVFNLTHGVHVCNTAGYTGEGMPACLAGPPEQIGINRAKII